MTQGIRDVAAGVSNSGPISALKKGPWDEILSYFAWVALACIAIRFGVTFSTQSIGIAAFFLGLKTFLFVWGGFLLANQRPSFLKLYAVLVLAALIQNDFVKLLGGVIK